MEKNKEKKGKTRSIREQVLRGWKRLPQPVRTLIIVAAFAGITLFFVGLFRQPRTVTSGGASAFDETQSSASESETGNSGSSKDSSGEPDGQNPAESETSGGKTDRNDKEKDKKSDEKKTESTAKDSEKTTESSDGTTASKKEEIRKLVALTYDDGPSDSTPLILDTLEKYGAKATFFVVGRDQVEYHQETLIRAYNDGMEIGSHTYDHRILSKSTKEEIWETMRKNDELLDSVIGFRPTIMRPTGGGINDTVREAIDRPMILWNIDTLDWKYEDKDMVVSTVKAEVHPGAIILMHDLLETTGDSTWQATAELVPWLMEQGYELVTVTDMAKAYGYTLEPGAAYYSFNPLWSPNAKIAERYQKAFAVEGN